MVQQPRPSVCDAASADFLSCSAHSYFFYVGYFSGHDGRDFGGVEAKTGDFGKNVDLVIVCSGFWGVCIRQKVIFWDHWKGS